jgi:hypothetical protein
MIRLSADDLRFSLPICDIGFPDRQAPKPLRKPRSPRVGCGLAFFCKIRWPSGVKTALWIVPNVEHDEYLPARHEGGTRGRACGIRMCSATASATTATGSASGVMRHGMYNTRYRWDDAIEEERAAIAERVELYRSLTGRHLRGWFSPAASYTLNTPDLIAEAGITYDADWHHDDQPLPLRVREGTPITVPH